MPSEPESIAWELFSPTTGLQIGESKSHLTFGYVGTWHCEGRTLCGIDLDADRAYMGGLGTGDGDCRASARSLEKHQREGETA